MRTNFSSAASGFIVGIWFASLWPLGWSVAVFSLCLAPIFFLARFFFAEQSEKKFLKIVAIFLLFFAVGNYRADLGLSAKAPELPTGQFTELEGTIAEEPKPGATSNQLILKTAEGYRVLLITDLYPEYRYGDQLTVAGKLVLPENFDTEIGREFDYANYLARQEIYYEMFRPEIKLDQTPGVKDAPTPGVRMRSSLIWLRGKIMSGISSVLPEPQAGLLGGLLIGARQSLDRDILEQFRRVGLSHMVVLSGYNLTIVAEAIRAVLGFLPLYAGLGAASFGIVLFALLAGGGAAVWRATLMALLAVVARATGRVYQVTRALVITVVALLLWDPSYLVFDLGFQLSVLATLGLLFLSPLITPYFRRLPKRFGFQEVVVSTIAAQIAVLPWLLFKMGELSLVSFLVNPLVLVVVPTIMLFGFLAGLFSFVGTWLAFISGSVAYVFLSYQLIVVSFFSRLSFASITISSFPLYLVVLIYGLYIYWYYRKGQLNNLQEGR